MRAGGRRGSDARTNPGTGTFGVMRGKATAELTDRTPGCGGSYATAATPRRRRYDVTAAGAVVAGRGLTTHVRGLPSRGCLLGLSTVVGGPGVFRAYERWAGCARTIGRSCCDRHGNWRVLQVGPGSATGSRHRLDRLSSWSGGGDLRGRTDWLRPGSRTTGGRAAVRGCRTITPGPPGR